MSENPLDRAALAAERQRAAQVEAQARDTDQQVRDGIAAIQQAQQNARADAAKALDLVAQAEALSEQIAARITAVSAFTPSATYQPAQLAAVASEIAGLLTRQKQITDALAEVYRWRHAVDQNADLTDGALLGLVWLITHRED